MSLVWHVRVAVDPLRFPASSNKTCFAVTRKIDVPELRINPEPDEPVFRVMSVG